MTTSKKRMTPNQFYCLKCKKRVKIKSEDICEDKIKNKKRGSIPVLRAVHNKCGTKLIKFVKQKKRKSSKKSSKKSKRKC